MIGFFFPGVLLSLKPYNQLLFSITMFGIGMVLHFEDFKNILLHPREMFLGVTAQYTIMPLSAYAITKIFNLAPEIAVGIVLTGSAPGAMTSNVISYLAGADVAFSVSLTSLSTLLSPILTPFLTLALAGQLIQVSFLAMFWSIVNMIIIPLFLGFIVKHFYGRKIHHLIEVFPAISVVAIALICGIVVALNKTSLLGLSSKIFTIVFILNLLGMILAFFWAKTFKFNKHKIKTLMIEISMQNAGLGVVLALKHFSPITALPSAVFTIWCIISASILVKIWKIIRF
ncbi:MAG: bile acid:sodium symporter family protein [Candidatus Margulisbacteria bacterium]|nr:bile acid:sodium symporter family protein [Candidatus Margulisiibacteriota bacterium]